MAKAFPFSKLNLHGGKTAIDCKLAILAIFLNVFIFEKVQEGEGRTERETEDPKGLFTDSHEPRCEGRTHKPKDHDLS